MLTDGKLVMVTLPYATYGIIVKDGIVVDAPPIARWMVGKGTAFVRSWIKDKGGTAALLDNEAG